jgi:hypothetical protein
MTTTSIIVLSAVITALFAINLVALVIAALVYRELNAYGQSVSETKGLLLKLIMDSNILTQSIYTLSAMTNELGELISDFSIQIGRRGPMMGSETDMSGPLFNFDDDDGAMNKPWSDPEFRKIRMDSLMNDRNIPDPLDETKQEGYIPEKGKLDIPKDSNDINELKNLFERFLEENEEEDLEA